jgi:hypothetical protein
MRLRVVLTHDPRAQARFAVQGVAPTERVRAFLEAFNASSPSLQTRVDPVRVELVFAVAGQAPTPPRRSLRSHPRR